MSEASKQTCSFKLKDSDAGPPQPAVGLLSIKDVTTTLKQPDLPVDVLLLTVKDCEFLSCYNELKYPYRYYYKDVDYVYFNNVQSHEEKVKVALLRCNEGSIGPSSSLIAVKDAALILQNEPTTSHFNIKKYTLPRTLTVLIATIRKNPSTPLERTH